MNGGDRESGSRVWSLGGAAAILAASLWVYRPAWHGGWLWDDDLEVTGNAVLREAAGWWKPWMAPAGMDYFPLKNSAQWLEWRLWGDSVTGYHLANIALHAWSALLVWRLLSLLVGPAGRTGAWFGGLIFAVHPLAVESVAWIAEFKNVLSLPLLLAAAICWVKAEAAGPESSAAWRRDYFLALAGFLAAMLCKTTVVMFPVVLLFYAWWRRGRIDRRDWLRTLPFFAVSLGLGLVTLAFQRHRAIGLAGPMPAFGPRWAQAGWSALAYLRAGLWPSGLAAIYPPTRAAVSALWPWLALAGLGALVWRWRQSWGRAAVLGLGWFFLNLVPVLGFVPMSYLRVAPRADHLAYLPLVGLAGLAGVAFVTVAAKTRPQSFRSLLLAAAVVGAGVLGLTAHRNAANFRNSEALWTATVERNPGAWLACNNLGRERLRAGRLEEARGLFEQAIRTGPPSAEVHANLGLVDERLGRPAEARAEYETALRLDPGFGGAHYNLGNLLLSGGEPEAAAEEFQAALRADPTSAMAHNNLGVAWARLGRSAEAQDEFHAALRCDPRLADAWVNLGNALFRAGHRSEAVEAYRAALAIAPENAAARHNLAAALKGAQSP